MDLYLVRHTPVNLESKICYGQLDLEADSSFSEHCSRLLPLFEELKNSKAYVSPLKRCISMAKYFYRDFNLIEDLKEINFGDWEGKSWDEIPRHQIDQWAINVCDYSPLNGESLREMNFRVLHFMKNVEAEDIESIVLFTHAGPIRSILAHYMQLDLENTLKIHVDFSSVSKIIVNDEFARIEYVNRVSSTTKDWV